MTSAHPSTQGFNGHRYAFCEENDGAQCKVNYRSQSYLPRGLVTIFGSCRLQAACLLALSVCLVSCTPHPFSSRPSGLSSLPESDYRSGTCRNMCGCVEEQKKILYLCVPALSTMRAANCVLRVPDRRCIALLPPPLIPCLLPRCPGSGVQPADQRGLPAQHQDQPACRDKRLAPSWHVSMLL